MKDKIMAYVRKNGEIGFRNHVLVLSSVVCANQAVSFLGQAFDEVITITHQHGCSQGGADRERTLQTLAGVAANPNVAAVLLVGLGCEAVPVAEIAELVGETGKPLATLEIQDCGGVSATVDRGKEIVADMLQQVAAYKRQPVGLGEIILGTECGGSDAFSGISGNPAIGSASDLVIENNGTAILSETPELIGAEHVLMKRSCCQEVADKLLTIVEDFEKKALDGGIDIRGANPSPGNVKGGITTLEEKSLGCIHKGGTTEIKEVIDYGCKPSRKGLVVMDTPGNDVESLTGMAAGGSQVMVFSTGRGTPAGFAIAPVIKVATNTATYNNMKEHMDINAGTIIDGTKSISEVGQEIYDLIVEVASGKLTKAEAMMQTDFSINRIGPTF